MTWHVWVDGSCQHGLAQAPKGVGGWGGWAAIVHHGSDGIVLRGRVPDTTSVRMELLAAIEGLRAVADGAHVVLHTDCMTVHGVYYRWRRGEVGSWRGPDAKLWLELDAELARVRAEIKLVVKGEVDREHQRAHAIAGAEARGGLRNLPPNAVPLEREGAHRLRKHLQEQAVQVVHARGCSPGVCVASCPVAVGALVYGSRRRSEARR